MPEPKMKTLDDIQLDLSRMFDQLKAGTIDSKTAGKLIYLVDKAIKPEQLRSSSEYRAEGDAGNAAHTAKPAERDNSADD
jgi:hypothetical protein